MVAYEHFTLLHQISSSSLPTLFNWHKFFTIVAAGAALLAAIFA
ncbi:MAG TPA: hypothetical protein VMI06_06260 [Terriglobia bacterium]|nr:hypothetical protein [Terriglobia bacterium]